MDNQLAKSLVYLVNNESYRLIGQYVEHRIDKLHIELETEKDPVRFHSLQGQIQELKRFRTLREEVLRDSKEQ